jgi:TRAP-type C4-dicarboxylate transport system permease small subunit
MLGPRLKQSLLNAYRVYSTVLRAVVLGLNAVASVLFVVMMTLTTCDVILRTVWRPITGTYDWVTLCGCVALAFSLPYATAVKGHVAVEFFFHKLNRHARTVVDTLLRLLSMSLFSALCWRGFAYARDLTRTGEGTLTLKIPLYPAALCLALAFGVVVLVILHNLLHPGREMIKP